MNITVNGKEYILEYTFEAAECHECIVQQWIFLAA